MHYPCSNIAWTPHLNITKVEKNRVIWTDIINLEIKITWISTKISLGMKMAPYTTQFLHHIGGWIHHQTILYGHTSILCTTRCDRAAANFITSIRDWGMQIQDSFYITSEDGFIIRPSYMDIHLSYALRSVIGQLRTSSHQLQIEVGRYTWLPLEERICQLCHQGVESKEHYVCHCSSVFYEIRRLWPTTQGNGIWGPTGPRTFLARA